MVIQSGAVSHIFIVAPVISWKMRNAFVVLVSLCIGLAAGFIVPSGLEFMGEDHAILAENAGKESEETKRATLQDVDSSEFIVLPPRTDNKNTASLENHGKRIKENDLYDQHSTKQNNVNERSFVYLNQKYKSPTLNQIYSNTRDLLKETYKAVVTNLEEARKYPAFIQPSKEYFIPNKKATGPKAFYFLPANYGEDVPKTMAIDQNKKEFNIHKEGNTNRDDEKHEYVELLKPPLLRPVAKHDKKMDETLQWPYSGLSYNNYKPLNNNIKDTKSEVPLITRQFPASHYDNYGFLTPYGYRRSESQYSPEELRLAANSKLRLLADNQMNKEDPNKLMDRYLKETMEAQVANDRTKAKNCSYSECILKSRKQYINSRVHSSPECKCGRKLNLKRIPNEDLNNIDWADTTDRTTESAQDTPSSEMNEYSDILTEEMNLKKIIDE